MTTSKPRPAGPPAAATGVAGVSGPSDLFAGRTAHLRLPFTSAPLRSNDRMHPAKRARLIREVRHATHWQAKADRLAPFPGPVQITCVWTVTDRRTRDEGALAPTLKAAIDGLCDAGVLPNGDGSDWVHERFRIDRDLWPSVALEIVEVQR